MSCRGSALIFNVKQECAFIFVHWTLRDRDLSKKRKAHCQLTLCIRGHVYLEARKNRDKAEEVAVLRTQYICQVRLQIYTPYAQGIDKHPNSVVVSRQGRLAIICMAHVQSTE